ncbi:hypothetical protein E2C01_024130 [Portunus trituberculatus]|uniref:Uncharacterized protein n=1 Tax=Portunus trituberculatus TaxID=210409 RepID=A0A5B7EBW1_PORTR|nr:hypothetical protein [Portunus trituberculatus]
MDCAVIGGAYLLPPVWRERWHGGVVLVPGEQVLVPRYITTCPAAPSSHSCTKHLCFLNRSAILVPSVCLYVYEDMWTDVRSLPIHGR